MKDKGEKMSIQIDMFDIINTRNENPDKKIPETANLKKKSSGALIAQSLLYFKWIRRSELKSARIAVLVRRIITLSW